MAEFGIWDVGPKNRWEMRGWPSKQVGDERMALKTGGSWDVEKPLPSPLL